MSEVNKWFYSLTLNELQQYIVRLEVDNERLVRDLTTSNKMNALLESIVKSTQMGYSLLRRIEINKNCECNEHRNQELRKALNESIGETNLLLNHLHQALTLKDADNGQVTRGQHLDKYELVDITCEDSNESMSTLRPTEDKSSNSSSGSLNSDYDSMDVVTNGSLITGAERQVIERAPEMKFRAEYSSESHSKAKLSDDLPQNLSKPKSPHFSPITSPAITVGHEPAFISTLSSLPPLALTSPDKTKHQPCQPLASKCADCDLSAITKTSVEQQLLTHINTTFTVQRAGRGRPAKNDPRVLRVTDSDLNILRMNEALAGLPEGVISLSALEELRRTKLASFGRYRCPWPDCGYTPHFLRDLRRHMFKHTGDKKYKCDLNGCDFVTVWKTSLLQHQRKKHNVTEPSANCTATTASPDTHPTTTSTTITATNTSVITNSSQTTLKA